MKNKYNFLIIGAGIGGLTTAIALQKAGYSVKVYESALKLLPLGAGIMLSGNAIKAYDEIGIASVIKAVGNEMSLARIQTSKGKLLSEIYMEAIKSQYGYATYCFHRADLQAALVGQLLPDTLVLGKKTMAFGQGEQGVTVNFSDTTSASGDYLIAADGVNSVIRNQLHPSVATRYSGYTCWRGICSFNEADYNRSIMTESWGVGERMGVVPLTDDRVYWFMVKNAPAKSPSMSAYDKSSLSSLFSDWHYPIEKVLSATPETGVLWNDIEDIAPLKTWGKARVTLLGDAAHATTPNMGQGACQAIEDAVFLVKSLEKYGLGEQALRHYESLRIPRTSKIIRQSWQLGKMGQLSNPILRVLRNLVVRLTPKSVMLKQLRWLYDVNFEA